MNKNKLPIFQLSLLSFFMVVAVLLFAAYQRQLLTTTKIETEVGQLALSQAKLSELSRTMPELMSEVSGWLRTLPTNQEEVAFFAAIVEAAAKEQSVTVSFSFNDFPDTVLFMGKNFFGLGTDINLEGSFLGITNFVSSLSKLPYFFKIDKMTILQRETRQGVRASLSGVLMMNQVK